MMECEEKCFTVLWKLENISYCFQKKGQRIERPLFVMDAIEKTKWKLWLYPRGMEDGNYMGYCLQREKDTEGPDKVEIKCELAFLSKDGTTLKSVNMGNRTFEKNKGFGCPLFQEREDVFLSRRSEFLPEDTLRACCRIWKVADEITEDVRCIAYTRIGVEKRSFVWNVINFSTLETEKIYTYEIKSINNDAPLMSIELSLTGGVSFEQIIRFELFPKDQRIKFSTLQLSLVSASEHTVECHRDEFWFDNGSASKEFKFVFSMNQLIAMKNSYLPNDTLSLHWEWVFSEGVISEKIENFQEACVNSRSTFSNPRNMDNKETLSLPFDLNLNLKSLCDENFLCDVHLKTKKRSFNAHMIILSASSSVFKAMFSSDMKEKASNSVNIDDLNDDTVNRMLHYIYTTRVEDLTWVTASSLYVAADKYAILSLKNICTSYLKDHLTSINACELLLLSDLHADDDLKSSVQNYILKHTKVIVNSDEWKLIMETNAKLAAETLCLQYK